MIEHIGIGWHVGVPSGWGIYGVNLCLQFVRKGIKPAILLADSNIPLTEPQLALLKGPLAEHPRWNALVHEDNPTVDFPFLHALGNNFQNPGFTSKVKGRPDIAVVFFETGVLSADSLESLERYATIVTGSSWNAQVLERHGVDRVVNCPQGVDLELFKPGPRTGRFGGRFTVFTGGKLEYRKGQDLVVAAFKRFYARHRDALLVTAWHNPWPVVAKGLALSPHVTGKPGVDQARLDVARWLRGNGLTDAAFFDIGPQPNAIMPAVLREMDLAIFPNRCEGGTNLVAMECMAMGIPTVLSRNTGHLDLIMPDNCYSLDLQIPMGDVTGRDELKDWGESSIEELVTRMEQAYTDRADAKARGDAGAAFMQSWDWSTQTDKFLAAIAPVV